MAGAGCRGAGFAGGPDSGDSPAELGGHTADEWTASIWIAKDVADEIGYLRVDDLVARTWLPALDFAAGGIDNLEDVGEWLVGAAAG